MGASLEPQADFAFPPPSKCIARQITARVRSANEAKYPRTAPGQKVAAHSGRRMADVPWRG